MRYAATTATDLLRSEPHSTAGPRDTLTAMHQHTAAARHRVVDECEPRLKDLQ